MANCIVNEPVVQDCPPTLLHSRIDIDSFVIVSSRLKTFEPSTSMKVYVNQNRYKKVQNKKATGELEDFLKKNKVMSSQSGTMWFECRFADSYKHAIYALFLVQKSANCKENYARAFCNDVAKASVQQLTAKDESTKHYAAARVDPTQPAAIFFEDYEEFANLMEKNAEKFLKTKTLIKQVFYYKCSHDLKCRDMGHIMHQIRKQIVPMPKDLLFVQLHFGAVFNAPDNSLILMSLDNVKKALGTDKITCVSQCFLKPFGHLFSYIGSKVFRKIK